MAIFEVAVNRLAGDVGTGNQTVAIFRISDDGEMEPQLINPPDAITVASLRRALDLIEAKAAVAAGQTPSSVRAKRQAS